jgi:hypothetical protein
MRKNGLVIEKRSFPVRFSLPIERTMCRAWFDLWSIKPELDKSCINMFAFEIFRNIQQGL